MKYTKHLQILFELYKVNKDTVQTNFSFWNISISNNKKYLVFSPKLREDIGSSMYKIEISKIPKNKKIDYILEQLKTQANHLNDADTRIANIQKIMNDEKFKEQLQIALNELLLKQNKITA